MVSCKQCTASNSLDSAYCKRCGAALDQQDLADASARLTQLIADGNKLYADGRSGEAMIVAERAVMINPSSPAALSLKGMCHERAGQIAEALECFEKVVELNPSSTLDRIKVNDLKNLIVARNLNPSAAPQQRWALVGAAAAMILIISGGAALARVRGSSDAANRVASNTGVVDNTKLTRYSEPVGTPATSQVQQPANQVADPNALKNSNPNPNAASVDDQGSQTQLPPAPKNGELPFPGGTIGFRPVNPGTPPTGPVTKTPGPEVDPPPTNNGPDRPTAQPDPPREAPGIIEIKMAKNGGASNSGGTVSVNANGREALVRTAKSQYQLGNVQAAASTFEQALRAGADPGSTNQRLGQCYEKLGRPKDAIAAYTRAQAAYETAGSTTAAESCKAAIELLRGG